MKVMFAIDEDFCIENDYDFYLEHEKSHMRYKGMIEKEISKGIILEKPLLKLIV